MASKIKGKSMENKSDGFKNRWNIDGKLKRWLQKSMENQSNIKAMASKIDGKSMETGSDGFKNRQTIDGKLKR